MLVSSEQRARARKGDATDQPYVAVAVARPSTAVPTEPLSEVEGRVQGNRDVRRTVLRTGRRGGRGDRVDCRCARRQCAHVESGCYPGHSDVRHVPYCRANDAYSSVTTSVYRIQCVQVVFDVPFKPSVLTQIVQKRDLNWVLDSSTQPVHMQILQSARAGHLHGQNLKDSLVNVRYWYLRRTKTRSDGPAVDSHPCKILGLSLGNPSSFSLSSYSFGGPGDSPSSPKKRPGRAAGRLSSEPATAAALIWRS
jgi:hypothetical protein